MKIAVLHDAPLPRASADALDNLRQAEAVSEALRSLGHEPVHVSFAPRRERLRESLDEVAPDVVFNLVESVGGQGRLIHVAPAHLEAFGLPFTGAGSAAMFASSGKLVCKRRLRSAGLPTPAWIEPTELMSSLGGAPLPNTARTSALRSGDHADEGLPGRWIVKSVWEHASIGLDDEAVLDLAGSPGDAERLLALLRRRAPLLGWDCFAEAFVVGREFNLALLERSDGVDVLPPAEIEFRDWPADRPAMVGYKAKWEEASGEYLSTVRRFDFPPKDGPLLDLLAAQALAAWRALGLRGYARVDFRVDEEGSPFIIDVNANPCLSPDAGFAAAATRAGLSFEEAASRILATATCEPCSA